MPFLADEIGIRAAAEGDIPRVIELMRVALGEGKIPRTREFFDWKHRKNPFGQSPMWVAEVGGQLVGVRLFMRWQWRWQNGHVASAVRAVDTATHPDFQGKGIFKKLTLALVDQVAQDGVEFIFNTPNEKSRPGYLKMGWTAAGKAGLWLRPEVTPTVLARLLKQLAGPTIPAMETPVESDGAALLAAIAEAERNGLLDATATRQGANRYATPKSAVYLRWRYALCPAATYRAASADSRRAITIYRARSRHGFRELSISELLFERSPKGVRAAAGSLALARQAARADYAIVAFERDPWQALALSAAGFVPAPGAGPILTSRPLNRTPGSPDPLSVRSFRASIGDLELF